MFLPWIYACFMASLSLVTVTSGNLDVVWAKAEQLDDNLIWRPVLPSRDYYVIGQYVHHSVENRYHKAFGPCSEDACLDRRIPVARATADELIEPLGAEQVLTYENKMFWKLRCPPNYVSLSGVAVPSRDQTQPDISQYRCVHQHFVKNTTLYIYFRANGLVGMWALPVRDRSIGSFYVISEPDEQTFSAIGYQLVVEPNEYEPQVQTNTDFIGRLEQITGRPEQTTLAPSRGGTSPTPTTPRNIITRRRDVTVLLASAVVVASSITACVLISLYCLKYRRKLKIVQPPPTSQNEYDITPEFVFSTSSRSPPSVNNYRAPSRLNSERVMRMNMLYEHHQCSDTV